MQCNAFYFFVYYIIIFITMSTHLPYDTFADLFEFRKIYQNLIDYSFIIHISAGRNDKKPDPAVIYGRNRVFYENL